MTSRHARPRCGRRLFCVVGPTASPRSSSRFARRSRRPSCRRRESPHQLVRGRGRSAPSRRFRLRTPTRGSLLRTCRSRVEGVAPFGGTGRETKLCEVPAVLVTRWLPRAQVVHPLRLGQGDGRQASSADERGDRVLDGVAVMEGGGVACAVFPVADEPELRRVRPCDLRRRMVSAQDPFAVGKARLVERDGLAQVPAAG